MVYCRAAVGNVWLRCAETAAAPVYRMMQKRCLSRCGAQTSGSIRYCGCGEKSAEVQGNEKGRTGYAVRPFTV